MKKILIASMLLMGVGLMAQPDNPPPPTPLPGIALLVAAGAALGAKKVYDSRKSED
jgi:hypothetical protein